MRARTGCCSICLSLLLACCALAATAHAQTANTTQCSAQDEAALRQIAEDWKRGYNHGEAAKVAALYTPDAYYLTQHFKEGIVRGREQIKAYVQHGIDVHYRVDVIEVIAVTCAGDFAYTIDRYESTNAGQKAFGVNLVVLRKLDQRWLIVAHEAAVPDPATAIQSLDIPARK